MVLTVSVLQLLPNWFMVLFLLLLAARRQLTAWVSLANMDRIGYQRQLSLLSAHPSCNHDYSAVGAISRCTVLSAWFSRWHDCCLATNNIALCSLICSNYVVWCCNPVLTKPKLEDKQGYRKEIRMYLFWS